MTPHAEFANLNSLAEIVDNGRCLYVDIWGFWPSHARKIRQRLLLRRRNPAAIRYRRTTRSNRSRRGLHTMKLLLCGSEGTILSQAIPHLLAAGHEVTGIDTCKKWGQRPKRRDYRLYIGDCTDANVVRSLMHGMEGVIQGVATLYGVVGYHEHAAEILTNDIAAHQTTLRVAADAGVSRVVFLSSSVVYEQSRHEPHREEEVEFAGIPRTDYGISKIVNERLSRAYATPAQSCHSQSGARST